jgi:hypothetical protein
MKRKSKVLNARETRDLFTKLKILDEQNLILVSRGGADDRLNYDWALSKQYLMSNCSPETNNCPDNVFDEDCTHFVSHAMNHGNVFVRLPTAECQSGLCIRVNDLAASFHASASKYPNVHQLTSHADTQEGDFCFIPGWFGLKKTHAMVLAGPASESGAPVWAHTNAHCGDAADFEGQDCIYYRIDP